MRILVLLILLVCPSSLLSQTLPRGIPIPRAATPPPIISLITIDQITTSSGRVNWTTDVASDSLAQISTIDGGPYTDCLPVDPTPTTAHHVVCSSLPSATEHFVVVKSCEIPTNCAQSSGGAPNLNKFTTSSAGAQLLPTYGIEVDGYANSTPGYERNVIIPDHWSGEYTGGVVVGQPQPSFSATSLVGNGSSCTATISGDPTSGSPRFRVGGRAIAAGMTDGAANGEGWITALTSNSVTYGCSFNGTTSGGTIYAGRWRQIGEDEVTTHPTIPNAGPMTRPISFANSPGNCVTGGQNMTYNTYYHFNIDNTLALLGCPTNPGWFVFKVQAPHTTYFTSGWSQSNNPVWSRTDPDLLYYRATNVIYTARVSTGVKTPIRTFTECENISVGGTGSNQDGGAIKGNNGHTLIPLICTTTTPTTVRKVTLYDAESDSYPTWWNGGCAVVDSWQGFPDGNGMFKSGSGTGNCQGTNYIKNVGGAMVHYRHVLDQAHHGMTAVSVQGNNVMLVTINSIGYAGPCNGSQQGFIILNMETSAMTCVYNMKNSSAGGGVKHLGGEIATWGSWWTSMLWDSCLGKNETNIGSNWSTCPARGSAEIVVGIIDEGATRSRVWRITHLPCYQHNATGTAIYDRTPWANFVSVPTTENLTNVPDRVFVGCDLRDPLVQGMRPGAILVRVR